MHTAEIEHHPLAKRFPFLRSEDTMIATLGSWTVGLLIFTMVGFYFGSIAGHDNHPAGQAPLNTAGFSNAAPWRSPGAILHKDLDPNQLVSALPYAAAGLLLGILFALWITFGYTPSKLRELDSEQGGHH